MQAVQLRIQIKDVLSTLPRFDGEDPTKPVPRRVSKDVVIKATRSLNLGRAVGKTRKRVWIVVLEVAVTKICIILKEIKLCWVCYIS